MEDVLLVAVDVALRQGVDPHSGDDPSVLDQREITAGPAQMCDVSAISLRGNAKIACYLLLSMILELLKLPDR